MSCQYTNHLEVGIAEVARIKFYEIQNDERTIVAELAMGLELLEGLAKTINKAIEQHKEKKVK